MHVPERAKIRDGVFAGCRGLMDSGQRIIVRGVMYDANEKSCTEAQNRTIRGTSGPKSRKLFANAPVRITKVPPGVRLDADYPEQDIVFPDIPRPEMPDFPRPENVLGCTLGFGMFPQESAEELQPISWHVVHVENGKALLLSQWELMYLTEMRYGVDANFHMTRIANSWIWKILNEGFLNLAFTEEERERIVPVETIYGSKEYIFLLTTEEISQYVHKDHRSTDFTPYAEIQRSKGFMYDQHFSQNNVWLAVPEQGKGFQGILANGTILQTTAKTSGGIRPALWLKLRDNG